jgi:phage baseplate assembly protein V
MLKFGIIEECQPDKGLYRVRIDEDDIKTKFIPVVVPNSKSTKFEAPLEVGEHVALLMDERAEDGIIVGAIYSEADKPENGAGENVWRTTFADGSYIKFDKSSGDLTVNTKGKVIVESASDVEITCTKLKVTGDVEVNGSITGSNGLEVTGKIEATGNIESTAGDVKALTISLLTHVHGGVTPGLSPTSTPLP